MVRFRNNRYQHREAAARFLLIEDSLKNTNKIVDTKKVYLDALAKRLHHGKPDYVEELKDITTAILNAMATVFVKNDELLMAQGALVVYYIIFKNALESGQLQDITRRALLDFKRKLSENRDLAVNNYEGASFDLLEYDRLNQQGTNDASGIKERVRILANFLNISIRDT
jgi:hypothetical protein